MTLLSPLALLLGLAALVPLVLHLRQQRKRTVVTFSTNRFFTQAVIRSQRRMRLQRLLLLLLRIAACLLLALALSRPLMDYAGIGAGHAGRRDLVILLDDSLSMRATPSLSSSTSRSTFDRARELAIDTLSHLSDGDRAAVVTFTGKSLGQQSNAGIEISPSPANIAAQLRDLTPSFASGDAHQALTRASELLASSGSRDPVVLVLSDSQSSDWREASWPQPASPVPMLFASLTPPTRDNVSIQDVTLGSSSQIAGQPGLLRARFVNHRSAPSEGELVLRVDDQEVLRRPVQLSGDSPRVEQLPLTLEKPGSHRLSVELLSPDALPVDNLFYACVTVHPRLPVLIIDGSVEASRQPGSFFLRMATVASSDTGPTQPDVVRASDLSSVRLDAYRVILMSEVTSLPLQEVERLEQFVRDGGGLAIFPGEGADLSFYNQTLGSTTRPLQGLMPAELRSIVTGSTDAPLRVLEAELDHPVLQRFKGTMRGALGGVSIERAFVLSMPTGRGQVLAAMDRGMPWLCERAYGRGRVLLLATPTQPLWTNLPLRRVFIPLLSRMVGYLAGGETVSTTRQAGQEVTLARGGWDFDKPVEVERPDSSVVRAVVRASGGQPTAYLAAESTGQPGYYTIRWPGSADVSASSGGLPGAVAVNVPRSESMPMTLDQSVALSQAGRWRVSFLDLSQDSSRDSTLWAALDEARAGRGVWDALLWVVLMLLLLEPVLANLLRGSLRWDWLKQRPWRAATLAGGQA
jgi:hypothetical protein